MTAERETLFDSDRMTKRERVMATLNHQPVDRVALLEQLSYNPRVIAEVTGRNIDGFNYTIEDIGETCRKTLDLAMPLVAPRGRKQVATDDGFVMQNDNWTSWHVSRPFSDEIGARDWLRKRTETIRSSPFDVDQVREEYRARVLRTQNLLGDTVLMDFSSMGFSFCFDAMGLEIFTFFQLDYPDVFSEYLTSSVEAEVRRVHAIADVELTPVVLIPEDFATKQGPIFPPDFMTEYYFPNVKTLVAAWKEHGLKVLLHSDGNWKTMIPDLIACDVDGFYCLETNCGMDIVELKNAYPEMVWSGGVDGVDLLERGTPEQVRREVRRQIAETRAVETGGMFVASSSEINPPIPPENFLAMVEAVARGE